MHDDDELDGDCMRMMMMADNEHADAEHRESIMMHALSSVMKGIAVNRMIVDDHDQDGSSNDDD